MHRLLAALALTLSATLLHASAPQRAACAWCSDNPCYSSRVCGRGCVCMRDAPEPGKCVHLSAVP